MTIKSNLWKSQIESRPRRFSRPRTELIFGWRMLNLLLVEEVKLSKQASQDEPESMISTFEVSFEEQSKNLSPIKSLDLSESVKGSDNWTGWNLRRRVSRVFCETNFLGQWEQVNLAGIFDTSNGEEIKEQAAMCLRKQTSLCLKEAEQKGQLNIIGNKDIIKEKYMEKNNKIKKINKI